MRPTAKAAALSACLIAFTLTGCPGDKLVRVPVKQYVLIEVPTILPDEVVKKCPVDYKKENTVEEAVRLANVNTTSLEVCAGQVDKARAINDQNKKDRIKAENSIKEKAPS